MEKLYVSREGLEKLKAELKECKTYRFKVADVIEQARGYGDLKENAEYHAAKEEQGMLHARIANLEHQISIAVVMDDENIDPSKAYLGATIRALNKKTNREVTYQLVSPVEMDMAAGKISVQSPVGKAFLGHPVGDTVAAQVPAGVLEFEILEISR